MGSRISPAEAVDAGPGLVLSGLRVIRELLPLYQAGISAA
jgi:hypothetical protein